jgi:hypothetical protein
LWQDGGRFEDQDQDQDWVGITAGGIQRDFTAP